MVEMHAKLNLCFVPRHQLANACAVHVYHALMALSTVVVQPSHADQDPLRCGDQPGHSLVPADSASGYGCGDLQITCLHPRIAPKSVVVVVVVVGERCVSGHPFPPSFFSD